MDQDIESYFEQKGVKPTANRILVLKALRGEEHPLTLMDLELTLSPMDKSSIFRELCGSEGPCDRRDEHIHFYCESCRQSFCMEDLPLPAMELPEGYTPHSLSFVIKGECPRCRRQHESD